MQTLVDLVKHSVVCEERNIMVNIIFEMITNYQTFGWPCKAQPSQPCGWDTALQKWLLLLVLFLLLFFWCFPVLLSATCQRFHVHSFISDLPGLLFPRAGVWVPWPGDHSAVSDAVLRGHQDDAIQRNSVQDQPLHSFCRHLRQERCPDLGLLLAHYRLLSTHFSGRPRNGCGCV